MVHKHYKYINPVCFKCISGINLSPADKNLLTISFIFIYTFSGAALKTKCHPILVLNGVLIPNLLNNHFAS